MFCTKCGKQVEETNMFCPNCGAPQPRVASAQVATPARQSLGDSSDAPYQGTSPMPPLEANPFDATYPNAASPYPAFSQAASTNPGGVAGGNIFPTARKTTPMFAKVIVGIVVAAIVIGGATTAWLLSNRNQPNPAPPPSDGEQSAGFGQSTVNEKSTELETPSIAAGSSTIDIKNNESAQINAVLEKMRATSYSYTYISFTGYEIKVTLNVSPWVRADDTTTIQGVWGEIKGGDQFPSLDRFGSAANGYTEKRAALFFVTVSFQNLTTGYSITPQEPLSAGTDFFGWMKSALIQYSNKAEYCSTSTGTAVKANMTGNKWGPVPMVVVLPNIYTPDTPDGDNNILSSTFSASSIGFAKLGSADNSKGDASVKFSIETFTAPDIQVENGVSNPGLAPEDYPEAKPPEELQSVSITYAGNTLTDFSERVGAEIPLRADIQPAGAALNEEIVWRSSDTSVFVVEKDNPEGTSATVTIIGAGTATFATLAVSVGGCEAECVIRVIGGTASSAPFILPSPLYVFMDTTTEFPPFYVKDSRGYDSGFDIDLLNALVDYFGANGYALIGMEWSNWISQLGNGECDIAISCITITEERRQIVDFTIPYIEYDGEQIGIAVRKDSTDLLNALNDALLSLKNDGTLDALIDRWF